MWFMIFWRFGGKGWGLTPELPFLRTKRRTKKNWIELKRTKAIKTVMFETYLKKSRIQETPTLLTDASLPYQPSSYTSLTPLPVFLPSQPKVGHLQPFYLFLSRLGCSLGELPLWGLTNFVRPNTWKTKKNSTSSYRQDMELCMTAISHVSTR